MIEYDKPIEVTQEQYNKCRSMSGVLAYRQEEGKYFVKLWYMKYKGILQQILET